MKFEQVRPRMGRLVYFDTGQLNMDGCSIREFILNGCMLRKNKKGEFYYQAELKELKCNSVIIVPLESVKNINEV